MPMTRERSSMKINPILKRELKIQSRGYTLLGLICGIDSALFLISVLGSLAVISRMRQDYHADYGSLLMIFVLVSMFAFLLILLICPSLTAGSIAGERRSKTLDLLLATRLSPVSIVTGKLLSAFSVVQILIITSIPALMVPLMYGGAGLPEILLTAVGLSCAASAKNVPLAHFLNAGTLPGSSPVYGKRQDTQNVYPVSLVRMKGLEPI